MLQKLLDLFRTRPMTEKESDIERLFFFNSGLDKTPVDITDDQIKMLLRLASLGIDYEQLKYILRHGI